jgi:hypothetical protein
MLQPDNQFKTAFFVKPKEHNNSFQHLLLSTLLILCTSMIALEYTSITLEELYDFFDDAIYFLGCLSVFYIAICGTMNDNSVQSDK